MGELLYVVSWVLFNYGLMWILFFVYEIHLSWNGSYLKRLQCWWIRHYRMMSVFTINTLRPRQSRLQFADDTFKCIFCNENVWIPIQISLKFVPKGSINNITASVQIMVWRRPGDKPLSEPMLARLPTHISVIRPHEWSKTLCTVSISDI